MSLTTYFFLTVVLIGAELLYLQVARHFGLFDKPNERSSHLNLITVRGGGVLFYLAALCALWIGKLDFFYFYIGLTFIACISFWDDLFTAPKRYRILIHVLAVSLLLVQEGTFIGHWWVFVGLLFMGVGIVNSYNFMDGINGMTAFYSLVTVGTLWYWQAQLPGEYDFLFPCEFIALLIFSYANARRQAICFAGDVGSISMGFIVLYGLVNTINRSHTYLPILFLAVYGVDSVLTIVHRLYRRQNIVQAHRMHLFQLLVHQFGWPHLRVSALYALLQLGINGLVLTTMKDSPMNQLMLTGLVLGSLIAVYIIASIQIDRTKKESVSKPTLFY